MIPNFTLSLSFDGIRLFHRSETGWSLVGEVSVDDPDLTARLADIRTRAEALASGPLRTKILLPNEQIKFTAIDSTMTTEDDVLAALDGATPYAVDDLRIDHDRSGGRTHIAAVAKETLQEAETFAVEHGFNPVAFVAAAEPFTFRSEVNFGLTKAAAQLLATGEGVDRDERFEVSEAEVALAEVVTTPPDVAEIEAETASDDATETEAAPDDASEDPLLAFASRMTRDKRPSTLDKTDDAAAPRPSAPTPTAVAPEPPEAMSGGEAETEVLFTRRRDIQPLTASRDMAPPPPQPAAAQSVAAPETPVAAPEAKPAPAVAAAPPPVTAEPRRQRDTAKPAAPKRAAPAEPVSRAKVGGKPRYLGLILTICLLIFLFLAALWANTLSDEGIAGWFKRPSDLVESEPVQLDPEVVTAPVQLPDPSPETDVAADVPAPNLPILRAPTGRILTPAEADRIYAATGVYQRAPRLPITPRDGTLDGFQEASALAPAVVLDRPSLPGFDTVAPDLAISAPNLPPPPGTRYLRDLRGFILAMPDGVVTPDGALVIAGSPEILPPVRPGTEIPEVAPQQASAPADAIGLRLIGGPPPIVPPLRPEGLQPEETDEVVVEAPEPDTETPAEATPPADLATTEPDAEIPASADALASVTAAVSEALAEVPSDLDPQLALEAPTAAAPDAESEAQQEAETAPEQSEEEPFVVITGTPDVSPPLRPAAFSSRTAPTLEDEDQLATEETALAALVVDPAVVGFRPSPRPNDLVSAAVLAGLSQNIAPPALRPEDAEPQAAEPETPAQPEASEIVAAIAAAAPPSGFVNVTASAVPVSLRPDTRPRNFSQVVARAQAVSARQQSADTVVASRPATPSGPVPGGVARAATVDNAIRLRDINLIGVYGRPNDRRALVRLSNGRFVKVEVGSRLDGGRVTAINESALNYVKGGRTLSLQLPSG